MERMSFDKVAELYHEILVSRDMQEEFNARLQNAKSANDALDEWHKFALDKGFDVTKDEIKGFIYNQAEVPDEILGLMCGGTYHWTSAPK